MKKKILTYTLPIIIAVGLIFVIKPYLDAKEVSDKYAFLVDSKDGILNNDSYKGKVLAIYFGYTYCPDVCPTTLSFLSHTLKDFKEDRLKNFEGLMISLDPARDKINALDEYAKYFHKNFKGATSDIENINDIVTRFGSFYYKVKLEKSSMDYSIAHTSYLYLFDKDGKFINKIDHNKDPELLKQTLEKYL